MGGNSLEVQWGSALPLRMVLGSTPGGETKIPQVSAPLGKKGVCGRDITITVHTLQTTPPPQPKSPLKSKNTSYDLDLLTKYQ